MEKVDVAKVDVDGLQATVNDTNTAVVANASSVASDPSIATDDQTKSTKSKHDYINVLFGVSLKTMKDIDDFTKGCEDGTYSVWNELESDVRTMVMEAVCGLAEAFSVETIAKSTTTKPTHESPIVQVDSPSCPNLGLVNSPEIRPPPNCHMGMEIQVKLDLGG
ncbi:hypothetical protein CTI12_AA174050 [Artemisia annua]|uniref:Uncharacterized protein n=1 Tax=Artemisia annua TaxID=35608 RepID=A0A2U1PA33_ARTAN|nr:hypothetical protein CTI12_AA174050 [Artemisia annua]